MTTRLYHLFTDGASTGNPGQAGIGAVVYTNDGRKVRETGREIGRATNNVAEYTALIAGLTEVLALGGRRVKCFLDSELVVRQLNGSYRVRDTQLRVLNSLVRHVMTLFESTEFHHVPRTENREADRLASSAARGKRR